MKKISTLVAVLLLSSMCAGAVHAAGKGNGNSGNGNGNGNSGNGNSGNGNGHSGNGNGNGNSGSAGNSGGSSTPVIASCTSGLTKSGSLDCTGAYSGNLGGALSTEQIGYINTAFNDNKFVYDSKMSYLKSDAASSTLFTDDGTDMSLNFKTAQKGLFVIGLKQSTYYSFYLFDGGSTGISEIAIDSQGLWNGGNGLSHAVYIGNLTPAVPEPGTYAMLLGGLGMMGWMVRRRKQA